DVDFDGNYNPYDGDYPKIKGCKAVYMIQNDAKGIHTYSGSEAMDMEIHFMFYQYKTWNYLDSTTFVDVIAINRGTTSYVESASGVFMDGNIGSANDDFFGCDSTNSV